MLRNFYLWTIEIGKEVQNFGKFSKPITFYCNVLGPDNNMITVIVFFGIWESYLSIRDFCC